MEIRLNSDLEGRIEHILLTTRDLLYRSYDDLEIIVEVVSCLQDTTRITVVVDNAELFFGQIDGDGVIYSQQHLVIPEYPFDEIYLTMQGSDRTKYRSNYLSRLRELNEKGLEIIWLSGSNVTRWPRDMALVADGGTIYPIPYSRQTLEFERIMGGLDFFRGMGNKIGNYKVQESFDMAYFLPGDMLIADNVMLIGPKMCERVKEIDWFKFLDAVSLYWGGKVEFLDGATPLFDLDIYATLVDNMTILLADPLVYRDKSSRYIDDYLKLRDQIFEILRRRKFDIYRIPMTPSISFNNVLMEIVGDEKRVYLPLSENEDANNAAIQAYQSLGFVTYSSLSKINVSESLGGWRCKSLVLSRS